MFSGCCCLQAFSDDGQGNTGAYNLCSHVCIYLPPCPPHLFLSINCRICLSCVSQAKHTAVLHLNPGPCASFQPLPLLAWALAHPSGPDCEPVLHGQLHHRAQGTQHDPFSFSCTDSTHVQGHMPPYTLPPGLCRAVLEKNASQLLVYLRALWLSNTSSTLPASPPGHAG